MFKSPVFRGVLSNLHRASAEERELKQSPNSHELPTELIEGIFEELSREAPVHNADLLPSPDDGFFYLPRRVEKTSAPEICIRRRYYQPALASASRVCRNWHGHATPMLYRDVVVTEMESLELLLRTLKKSTNLRGLIQSLLYLEAILITKPKFSSNPDDDVLSSVLELCPRLSLIGYNRFNMRVGSSFFNSNGAVQLRIPIDATQASSVTRLEITMSTGERIQNVVPPYEFTALQELVVPGCCLGDDTRNDSQWPAMPRLRRLRIEGGSHKIESSMLPKNMQSLRVFEFDRGYILSIYEFLEELHACAPNLEIASLTPILMESWFRASHSVLLSNFVNLVQLRASSCIFNAFAPNELPPNLRWLELYDCDMIEGSQQLQCSFMLAKLGALLQFPRLRYPELESINVHSMHDNVYDGCEKIVKDHLGETDVTLSLRDANGTRLPIRVFRNVARLFR